MKQLLACGLIVGVAACTAAPPATKVPAPATVASVIPPKSDSAPRSCVQLNAIREARVVDDRTIDFYMSGRQILRNTLPNACPQLATEKAFTYSTSLSQLCSVDVITVIVESGGPIRGASCGLGPFVPYTPAQ